MTLGPRLLALSACLPAALAALAAPGPQTQPASQAASGPAFPLYNDQIAAAVLKAVQAGNQPPNRWVRPGEAKVAPLASNNPATGGKVEVPSPLTNCVFRCVLLGQTPAAPVRQFARIDRQGNVSYPFKPADFGAVLAAEDRAKWTDQSYLDAARLYIHLTTVANEDGWRVLHAPQDFMGITFNMRKDEAGVRDRQAAADKITAPAATREKDKVIVKLWSWHNIGGRLCQWTVEFGRTFTGSVIEAGRFGGGGYD